jgi:6-phosphogluconolactonase
MQLNISKNIDELSEKVVNWMIDYIKTVLQEQDRFTIALSGGSTPKKLYQLLASDDCKNKIDWKKLHVFWGDERYVPFTDDRNNAKMAFDVLLSHVPIPLAQIHKVRTDIEPDISAKQYEKILHQYFSSAAAGSQFTSHVSLLISCCSASATMLIHFPSFPVMRSYMKKMPGCCLYF